MRKLPRVRVAMVAGDGSGPRMLQQAKSLLRSVSRLEMEFVDAEGGHAWFRSNTAASASIPQETVSLLRECKFGMFGAVINPRDITPEDVSRGYQSPIVLLRQALGLNSIIRRCANGSMDVSIVREGTEDLFVAQETLKSDEMAEAVRRITRKASLTVAQTAFREALKKKEELRSLEAVDSEVKAKAKKPARVTSVHKANILPVTDGLFLKACQEIAQQHEGAVEYEEVVVDDAISRLIERPESLDVLVAPNLYGDLLSDVAASLAGGLGQVPTANISTENKIVVTHGSDLVTQVESRPLAVLRSAGLLMAYMGDPLAAVAVERAVRTLLRRRETSLIEKDGDAEGMTDAVIQETLFQQHLMLSSGHGS